MSKGMLHPKGEGGGGVTPTLLNRGSLTNMFVLFYDFILKLFYELLMIRVKGKHNDNMVESFSYIKY